MDLEERLNLILRNTEEIVTREELVNLLETKNRPVTYCGYEMSGPVHLGTMFSVLKQIDLQKAGFLVKVLLPDLHTWLNRKGELEWIRGMGEYWRETLQALGLSEETVFVYGSDFEMGEEYLRDLFKMSLEVTVSRAKRSMQLITRNLEHATISQVLYPLMQALDIAHLGVDLAHGGIEQRKIHMLAREKNPLLGYPKPVCLHHPLIYSLQGPGTKMSSSEPETMITTFDDPATIWERVKKAYCPAGEVEGNPVVQICRYILLPKLGELKVERPARYGGDLVITSYEELEKLYTSGELHPLDLKRNTANMLAKTLEPVRKLYKHKPRLLDPLVEKGYHLPDYLVE